jgi:hypothetical protein
MPRTIACLKAIAADGAVVPPLNRDEIAAARSREVESADEPDPAKL